MLHDAIKEVTVCDPEPFTIGQGVDSVFPNLDFSEVQANKLADTLIVISGYKNDTRALAALAQNLLYNVIVGLGPVPPLFQVPPIKYISDQVEGFRFMSPEKVQEITGLATSCAQVDIGDPEGSVFSCLVVSHGAPI